MVTDNYSPDYARLPKLAELAAMHPEVNVIVNHLGGRIDLNEQEWKECLEKVSKQKNVFLKLGGAQQRVNDWEPAFHRNQRPQPISSDELCKSLGKYYVKAIELLDLKGACLRVISLLIKSVFPTERYGIFSRRFPLK